MKVSVWIVTLLAVASYAALIWVGMAAYAGQKPLELRVLGYSHSDVMQMLNALPIGAGEAILTDVRRLDTVFPVLLGLALSGWLWLASTGRGFALRLAALGVPAAYTAVDLYENALVARIIGGAFPSESLVAAASTATMVKFGLLALVAVVLFLFAGDGKEG